MNLNLINILFIVFGLGFIIGYNQREIRETLSRISAMINVKNNSGVVRGREVVSAPVDKPKEAVMSGIVKPKSPKEVARDSANKFMNDFDL